MCSFGSCQTRFEFLSQFRKVRNAFECFVTQVQTHLPKTKRVWPMKINVICTVAGLFKMVHSRPTPTPYIYDVGVCKTNTLPPKIYVGVGGNVQVLPTQTSYIYVVGVGHV